LGRGEGQGEEEEVKVKGRREEGDGERRCEGGARWELPRAATILTAVVAVAGTSPRKKTENIEKRK